MPSNYIIIGGGAYQPGSAAAKRAQELYNQWLANQPKPAVTVPSPSVPAATTSSTPTSFPTYAKSSAGGALSPSAGSLAPAGAVAGKGAYGLVPSTPNPVSTAAGSIAGNQSNLPALSTLGTDTTKLSAGLGQLPYQLNLPNYMDNLGRAAANVSSNLSGMISPTTSNTITRAAAERGVGMGAAPGSPNAQTNWMGVLGQTSEQLQALGANQLNQLIAATPTGQPFNVAGQQTTPGDLQYWQDVSNVRGAAPDPTEAAQANLDMLLRAIEAGKVAGNPGFGGGFGGGGGGGLPRIPTAPGAPTTVPYGIPYYAGDVGGGWAPRAVPTTAPGVVSNPTDDWVEQYLSDWEQGTNIEPPNYWPEDMPDYNAPEYSQYWPGEF